MNPRTVHIPSWKFSQVNKRESDGSIIPDLEIVTSNMVANAEAAETNGMRTTGNMIYICVREKLPDGDSFCGIAAIPVDKSDTDVVEVVLHQFQKMPHIVISPSKGIADVVKRVLKNIIFS
jgi:hypothetical protein